MQAVELARRERIDFLLAIGGGSVIDGTKFIAAAIPFVGEPWDIPRQTRKKSVARSPSAACSRCRQPALK